MGYNPNVFPRLRHRAEQSIKRFEAASGDQSNRFEKIDNPDPVLRAIPVPYSDYGDTGQIGDRPNPAVKVRDHVRHLYQNEGSQIDSGIETGRGYRGKKSGISPKKAVPHDK